MATKKGKSVTDWENAADSSTPTVFYRTLNVEGLEIFYREASDKRLAGRAAAKQAKAVQAAA